MTHFKHALILTALMSSGAAFAEDNTRISILQVPDAAMETARQFAPGIEFLRYGYEDETTGRIYEFEGRDSRGYHIEIDVTAEGVLEEIEIETPWDEVPFSVQFELDLVAPDFEPHFIEASTRPDGTTVYEFEGATEDGNPSDIEILLSGTGVKYLAEAGS